VSRVRRGEVAWLNVNGLGDTETIKEITRELGLHPLIVEDILNTDQRARFDEQQEKLFCCLKMLHWNEEEQAIEDEHVSLVLTGPLVVTFQEHAGDVFDRVRERIRKGQGRIRTMGPDYLAYSLLDAVVDGYFLILEELQEAVEQLEDDLLGRQARNGLERIHHLRRQLMTLKRAIWPMRELVSGLERVEGGTISRDTRPYLRDLHDHVIQVVEITDSLKEILGGLVEIHLSEVNNRMSSVMKVLTSIATIFIPLTFVAGIYGMNFQHMPELAWRWGYPAVLAVMGLIAGGLIVFFKRRGWF
jgi:magnesium transporter